MSNDAYTCNIHSQETKCSHGPPLDFNASSNEVPSEKVILSMQNNSSYQAASQWQFMTTSYFNHRRVGRPYQKTRDPVLQQTELLYIRIENIQRAELLCGSDKI